MILVTGANGFVGHKVMQMCKDTIACPSLREVSEDEIKRIVEESGVDTIIHTAAISDIGVCQARLRILPMYRFLYIWRRQQKM